jgi:signal transduction histidine kinase
MKTPIAIIQGYAEGAKMFYEAGNSKAAYEYCDVISEETVRMNNMIMRLLEITKYSSGAYEPTSENFNIRDMIEDWYEKNSALFDEKGITAVNDINPGYEGNGDSIILYSVINNYLSNAVSHTDGEKKILCRAEDTGECFRVYVFNTGAHIEEKHIDKIWDSFYRADKALSRSQGRFGLGLAIVASIQKLHNQGFGVQNVADGVEFWFDIKKA